MGRSRRATLRTIAVGTGALAGCGRTLRSNTAPGGLDIRNDRATRATVRVRAVRRRDEGLFTTATPRGTPTTVPDDAAVYAGEYRIDADGRRIVTDFFAEGGRYFVDITDGSARAFTEIELFDTATGAGADTVIVRLLAGGGIDLEVTEVD